MLTATSARPTAPICKCCLPAMLLACHTTALSNSHDNNNENHDYFAEGVQLPKVCPSEV